MDYLNYLPDTNYDDLPEDVQATISRNDYETRQLIGAALGAGTDSALPAALAGAFRAQTGTKIVPAKTKKLPWLAAAGWLLFLITAGLLFLRSPEEKTVYQLVSAPVPAPEIIRDTLIETVTERVFTTRVARDTVTVYQELPAPDPVFVYRTDTLYLPGQPLEGDFKVAKSTSAAKRIKLLDLLVKAE